MGQKVNPIGIRLKINRTWDSVWFAKKQNYGTYLIEDFKIRKYINNTIKNSGVSKILIERPSKKCVVTIYTSRPGFVIGKKGSDIEKIKKNISKITSDEVSVNIKEIRKPEIDSFLVCRKYCATIRKKSCIQKSYEKSNVFCIKTWSKRYKGNSEWKIRGNEIAN